MITIAPVDRWRGALLGLACGDAVGTTVEFSARDAFAPVTDMVGGGPFGLAAGEWTDDTSMALCLATSLVHRRGHDPVDQMNRYSNWWRYGYLSATGECFDIGMTVQRALRRYLDTGEPYAGDTDPRTAGNGALMRLAPVAMWFADDPAALHDAARASTRTTHAAPEGWIAANSLPNCCGAHWPARRKPSCSRRRLPPAAHRPWRPWRAAIGTTSR